MKPNTLVHRARQADDNGYKSNFAKFSNPKSICFVFKLYFLAVFYGFYFAQSKVKIGFLLEYE